jgi:hypothetical protein
MTVDVLVFPPTGSQRREREGGMKERGGFRPLTSHRLALRRHGHYNIRVIRVFPPSTICMANIMHASLIENLSVESDTLTAKDLALTRMLSRVAQSLCPVRPSHSLYILA